LGLGDLSMENVQSSPPLLQMKNIEKKYPGVVALNNVTFQINGGEIHALLGANGAGKSTLMKVLCGVTQPDAGEILIDGEHTYVDNPASAIEQGISYVPQELSLVPEMSVSHNVILGQEPFINKTIGLINEKKLRTLAKRSLDFVNLDVDIDQPVKKLPISDQQMITIATALFRNSKIFIFDEPTASLSYNEINKLFEILKKLRQDGHAIIFITHHLEEVFRVADRITVLRDAVYQGTFKREEVTREQIVTLMTGKMGKVIEKSVEIKKFEKEALCVEEVSTQKISKDISFSLHEGEILCLFGQVGSGRTDVMRAIFGADKLESGKIFLFGKDVKINTPIDAIKEGIGFITEDRKNQGMILSMDLIDNINMGNYKKSSRFGLIQLDKVRKIAKKYRDSLNIKNNNLKLLTKYLSGGNQQKVILAKWLNHNPKILFMDEPTKGIDVGAKQEFYKLIRDLANQNMAVLLITSELPEALGLSDRILVFSKGSIMAELKPQETTEEEIMSLTL
jgi:ribose transport system ATP-binding protein